MVETEHYPLRVTTVPAAQLVEWRTGDVLPRSSCPVWQLVYVRSGMIEEMCGTHRMRMRAGTLLIHQPEESYAMRALSDLPPEVLRIEFGCDSTVMDTLRDQRFHADPRDQLALGWVCSTVPLLFFPPEAPGAAPQRRPDPPFGTAQQLAIYLENLLIFLVRRSATTRRPTPRAMRENRMNAVVETARLYFSAHIEKKVTVDELCAATGYSKYQLNEAFQTRLHHSPLEEFSAMKLTYAAQLLARGAAPGEVAARLGYCTPAYFTKRFHAAMGCTPSAYRRVQQGLPAVRSPKRPKAAPQNLQQESKQESESSIPESAQNS